MRETRDFKVISFEQLKRHCTHEADFYDPSWDQAKGVVRAAPKQGERLGAERGDLIRVSHGRRRAVYILKMSPHLAEDTIALDYDQQKQLGVSPQSRCARHDLARSPICGSTSIRRSAFRSASASGSPSSASSPARRRVPWL